MAGQEATDGLSPATIAAAENRKHVIVRMEALFRLAKGEVCGELPATGAVGEVNALAQQLYSRIVSTDYRSAPIRQ
jgi:hypothetical protein